MNTRIMSTSFLLITILALYTSSRTTEAMFVSPYVGFGFNPIASSLYGYGLANSYGFGWGKGFGYGHMGGIGGMYGGKFPIYPYYGMGGFGYPFYGGMGSLGPGLGGLGLGGMGGYGMGYGMGGYGGYGGFGMGGLGGLGLGLGLLKKSESDLENDYYKRMAQDEAMMAATKKMGTVSGKYPPGTIGTVNA
ncbi:hypothetical protein RDWZM_006589 [Blomia tropicalis]|uniref:Uncharacterized protein n=1 Tax=Blomia tropicalis TaxID=40697 RepID=A0A9Q0M882_BLOTA|nr:hypothetical protein RDWZM_006589 [Blomia tropicalis]